MEELQTTVYRTEDGQEFTDKAKAEAHEAGMRALEERTSYWRVIHNPDLTEGRGYYGMTLLKVVAGQRYDPVQAMVEDYCVRTFGRRVQYVQGCAPLDGWMLTRLADRKSFEEAKKGHTSVGDYQYPAKWTYLSPGKGDQGLGESR